VVIDVNNGAAYVGDVYVPYDPALTSGIVY
jgi:hypothetical protein